MENDAKKSKIQIKYEKLIKKHRRMSEKINKAKKAALSKSATKNGKAPVKRKGRKRKNQEVWVILHIT